MAKKVIKVLSIDGGGIRGVIPAMILEKVEELTGKPISDTFDLIAGTSTGGLLSLGLTKPNSEGKPEYSASDLVELYATRGDELFKRSFWSKIISLGSFLEEKYSVSGLELLLDEYFGESELKSTLTDVIITSYALERRIPWFFKSRKAKRSEENNFKLKDVARATSAAPTYFEPLQLNLKGEEKPAIMIDGGVYANNPAMCAYVEAKSKFKQADEIILVSIGTGELVRPYIYEKAKSWGLASWLRPLLSVMFHGMDKTVDYQLDKLLNNRDEIKKYYRFQAVLTDKSEDMDNIRSANIEQLMRISLSLIKREEENLKNLCKQLLA